MEIIYKVQVTINGKQEYTITEKSYDKLCEELTSIYIHNKTINNYEHKSTS